MLGATRRGSSAVPPRRLDTLLSAARLFTERSVGRVGTCVLCCAAACKLSSLLPPAAHPPAERTVASYMRAVLRTLAQCHSQGILHRDIKPGRKGACRWLGSARVLVCWLHA